LLGVWDQRILLPASALLGALLLVLADTAARLLLAPVQIPVGVLTAAFGVPLLLFLLRQQSMRTSDA
jgi:iron complex transport system permease protein